MEEYFGVYKEDNWWVYTNANRSKKDSIYPQSYFSTTLRNRTTCLETHHRKFTLSNMHLTEGNPTQVLYESYETGIEFRWEVVNQLLPDFIYVQNTDTIISTPSFPGSNRLDSVILNNTTYYQILIGRYGSTTYYFAKNKGLVGWSTALDTFNLVNFKIL